MMSPRDERRIEVREMRRIRRTAKDMMAAARVMERAHRSLRGVEDAYEQLAISLRALRDLRAS